MFFAVFLDFLQLYCFSCVNKNKCAQYVGVAGCGKRESGTMKSRCDGRNICFWYRCGTEYGVQKAAGAEDSDG